MKAKYLLIIILIVSFCFTGNGEVTTSTLQGYKTPEGLNTVTSENVTNIFSPTPKKKKKKPVHKKKKKKKKVHHKKKKKKKKPRKKKKTTHRKKK